MDPLALDQDTPPAQISALPAGQNTAHAESDVSFSNPGPQNPFLRDQNPHSSRPPVTDNGALGPIWYSYELTHRRVQEGGWTHQVTERELPTSKDIAAVQMRLTAGAFRELHWHLADEWAYMLSGRARVTLLKPDGSMFVDDVSAGDLWLFPAGYPHSIQGLEPDGCEFLLVFNQGDFSEESTLLLSDWLAHTPPEILAKNFGLDQTALAKLPTGPLYIFPSAAPALSLAEQQAAAGMTVPPPPDEAFTFRMRSMPPTLTNAQGEVRIVDSQNFPASKHFAAGLLIIKPGGMREMHWHPNASEWQFYIQGSARMTVFPGQETARTMDFHTNDVGFVPKMAGHYIENTGTTDLICLEMFASPVFQDVSLNNWLRRLPPQVAIAHLGLSPEELQIIPAAKNELL